MSALSELKLRKLRKFIYPHFTVEKWWHSGNQHLSLLLSCFTASCMVYYLAHFLSVPDMCAGQADSERAYVVFNYMIRRRVWFYSALCPRILWLGRYYRRFGPRDEEMKSEIVGQLAHMAWHRSVRITGLTTSKERTT